METNTTGPTLLGATAPKPGQIRNPRSVISPRMGLWGVFFDIRITNISTLPGLRQLPGTGSTKLLQTGTATTLAFTKAAAENQRSKMSRGGRSRQGPDAATPYPPALPLCGVSKKNGNKHNRTNASRRHRPQTRTNPQSPFPNL